MDNKYICKSCKEDLREVGIYKTIFANYVYIENSDTFEESSQDPDYLYKCACCDTYIDDKLKIDR